MRILLIAALVSSLAVAGCGGGEKNSSTSANNSASANSSGSAAGGTGGAGGGTADSFRKLAITQCEQTVRSHPNAPAGFDASGTCNCAIQTAFGNQADPLTFAQSPEGRQALTEAIVSCGQQHMGGAAAGKGQTK